MFYTKIFDLLETFKHSMNTWSSQIEPLETKVLGFLEQNVRSKITP